MIISLTQNSENNLSKVVVIDHIPRKVEHSQADCDKQNSPDFSAQHLLDEREIQQNHRLKMIRSAAAKMKKGRKIYLEVRSIFLAFFNWSALK